MGKNIYILLLTMIFLTQCNSYNRKLTIQQKEKQKYFDEAEAYKIKYGGIDTETDTTIYKGKLTMIYEKGVLTQIGKTIRGEKRGIWYEYGIDSGEVRLHAITRYFKNDTTAYPVVLINVRW